MIVKILQWNVWRKESPSKIARVVNELAPDIFCAQEIMQNTNEGVDMALEISGLLKSNYECFYKEAVTWDKRPEVTSQGNAIYSKLPITKKDHFFVSPFVHNPENATTEGRVYLEADIKCGGVNLTVGTVHMGYSFAMENTSRRKTEADNLYGYIKNKNARYILTGDFNSVPDSYVINKIMENKNLVNAGPEFSQNTWPTKPFNYHGFEAKSMDWRVDYVFTSKDIDILSSEIIDTEVSDHLPILTQIKV
jgi:endonuclease/exonuclease/phosphatase family metal-dependent hydrolase